ncbi:MAG TPA: DNA mismatch repair endonuclease MutL [Terriglobia bacterium]|nr:DNA mismatch repair endonuclease MutL [Terriglobia bacterium]
MSIIRILPEAVANKIAAGEVVERPASVVKELVENALDAGAHRVDVCVEAGGKRLIRVEDDGVGMSRDDVLLAFERHATSKIKSIEDLFEVTTLGFRGEALPSIASVSRLMLETRHASETSGTQLEIAGGRLRNVKEIPWPGGTRFQVSDLFYNTPARRKFLKSESTELGHAASLVTHYALAHPEKSFRLASFTHEILNAPPVSSFRERIYQVMGGQTLDQLVEMTPVERTMIVPAPPGENSGEVAAPPKVGLCGFISRPEVQKLNRNQIYFFVNRRLVRDRLILHAITEAYRNILPGGMFPVVLIFLEIPPSEVDVNVHPSKTEVRFRHSGFVHDFARDSIRGALLAARPMAAFPMHAPSRRGPADDNEAEMAERLGEDSGEESGRLESAQSESPAKFREPARSSGVADFRLSPWQPVPQTGSLPLTPGPPEWPTAAQVALEGSASVPPASQSPGDAGARHGVPGQTYTAAVPARATSDEFPKNLRPLGQVRDSFIVATNDDGLWIIDQHVAHERVLFERHLKMRQEKKVEGQRLLLPIVVELKPEQQAIFQDIAQELVANGFDAEPFGQRTVAIKTAPSEVRAEDAERLLLDILDGAGPEAQIMSLDSLLHCIAASVACHAAIKVNMPLTQGKMEWLLRELQKTDCPMTCPHGRPVLLRYSLKEIQKAFKRA